ncbi:hypothetical protein AOLI_G00090670 [Acnodon oligacanthus]
MVVSAFLVIWPLAAAAAARLQRHMAALVQARSSKVAGSPASLRAVCKHREDAHQQRRSSAPEPDCGVCRDLRRFIPAEFGSVLDENSSNPILPDDKRSSQP